MRNEKLFHKYKELCAGSFGVMQRVLGDAEHIAWWDKASDAEIRRRLRGFSGIDEGSGFYDFTPPSLASYFSAFVREALKDPVLSRLYSEKDLGPILVYQLTGPVRFLARSVMMRVNTDEIEKVFEIEIEKALRYFYTNFENLLYEENWVTATIYPLVNFYSKKGWEERQSQRLSGIDDTKMIFPGSTFQIDNFEIKYMDFITSRLLDKPAETSGYRARSPYRDFTGDYYALEIRKPRRKSADSESNLISYLIGRPTAIPEDDTNLESQAVVDLPENVLLALRLFQHGDVGIAPYRYISDYPKPLYVPDLYSERYVELAQVEAYDGAPYILDPSETDYLIKLYHAVANLLSSKSKDLEHIDIAQRYFQYSYSYKLTDESRLQDRVVSLIFALEALLLEGKEGRSKLESFGNIFIGDRYLTTKTLIKKAYSKVRNRVAHGQSPAIRVEKTLVTSLENCVRWAIRRAVGLAVSQGVRTKEDLRQAIEHANEVNKRTRSETGVQQLRKNADTPFE